MSFETEAQLTLLPPSRANLQNVKQQIESEIGATELGIADGGTMSAQATGGGAGTNSRQGRQSYRLAERRTELLDEAVVFLEEIEDQVGPDDGVGGVGGLLTDFTNFAVDTGGDAGGAAALTGAAGALSGAAGAMTGAAGAHGGAAAALTGAAAALSNVAGGSVSVEPPGWIPIEVENPGTVGFKDLPGPVGFKKHPGPIGFKPLPGPVGFEDLPEPLSIEDPTQPYPLAEPPAPYPVEDVEPLEVEPVDVQVSVSTNSGGSQDLVTPPLGHYVEDNVDAGNDILPGLGGAAGVLSGVGRWLGSELPGGKEWPGWEGAGFKGNPESREEWQQMKRNEGRGSTQVEVSTSTGSEARSADVTVENSPRTNVTVDTDTSDIVDAVVDALEREFDSHLDDIKQDLQDVEERVDQIESGIKRSR